MDQDLLTALVGYVVLQLFKIGHLDEFVEFDQLVYKI